MADWARKVVKNPNMTTPADVQALRDAGLTDEQIFAVTVFVALRVAFSMVNDALGAVPDRATHRVAARRGGGRGDLRASGGPLSPSDRLDQMTRV